ncbi:MAG: class I SAM-dependent methyltransferase [Cyclobacteriaceae bacterium]
MKQFWEDRYALQDYAYGIHPNVFLKEYLHEKQPGNILLAAEGEGRNAVYAAKLGWAVTAFDYSEEAQKKALILAEREQVSFKYTVDDYASFQSAEEGYDVIALIYAHTDPETRRLFLARLSTLLSPGGEVVLEGFSKEQLGKSSGGPKSLEMLWDAEALAKELTGLKVLYSESLNIVLDEGEYHQGEASVIRIIASKEMQKGTIS